jgi:hypothetical protein
VYNLLRLELFLNQFLSFLAKFLHKLQTENGHNCYEFVREVQASIPRHIDAAVIVDKRYSHRRSLQSSRQWGEGLLGMATAGMSFVEVQVKVSTLQRNLEEQMPDYHPNCSSAIESWHSKHSLRLESMIPEIWLIYEVRTPSQGRWVVTF